MRYFRIIFIFSISCVLELNVEKVCGANPLESSSVRLECFGTQQPNCRKGQNMDFVDRYPSMSRSYDNTTVADTYFYMFPPCKPDDPEFMHKCAGNIPRDSNFNPDCRTEILVPGYMSGPCNMAIFRELKNEYFKNECCYNIMIVDWMWGNSGDLIGAAENLKIVGKQLAQCIINLVGRGAKLENMVCVGHSFGAHICGIAGYYVLEETSKKIASIVGLDPAAGPIHENMPKKDRLDASDAECVQATHCNSGNCLPEYFSANYSLGHMDFWFNGGHMQPESYDEAKNAFVKEDYFYATLVSYPPAYSHFLCVRYYEASINSNLQYVGVRCNSESEFENGNCRSCGYSDNDDDCDGNRCAVTGLNGCRCPRVNSPPPNNYYLNTSVTCPYSDNSAICLDGYSCCPKCVLKSEVKCPENLK